MMVGRKLCVLCELPRAVARGPRLEFDEPQPTRPNDSPVGGATTLIGVPRGKVELVNEERTGVMITKTGELVKSLKEVLTIRGGMAVRVPLWITTAQDQRGQEPLAELLPAKFQSPS